MRNKFGNTRIHDDIRTLDPPRADVVAGGWPCQDLSIAGKQAGLGGKRSGLLKELLRVAKLAKAETLIAENVPHLLRLNAGKEFSAALRMIHKSGFPVIGWRVLNSRWFGLPQNRSRIILIASHDAERVNCLFGDLPQLSPRMVSTSASRKAAGFYWTAGTHSLNYSQGYVPTLKVGSALGIPSLPAVLFRETVRQLTPQEAFRLQGFDDFIMTIPSSTLLRMVGNAVPRPIGKWAFSCVQKQGNSATPLICDETHAQLGLAFEREYPKTPEAGISREGRRQSVYLRPPTSVATNLIDFIDTSHRVPLSSKAASGLLRRLGRSGHRCPEELEKCLRQLAFQS